MAGERITIEFSLQDDGTPGELSVYLNPEGRDWLVSELLLLDERWDHLHLFSVNWSTDDVGLGAVAYDSTETTIGAVKVLLRPDPWDREHFPHVLSRDEAAS